MLSDTFTIDGKSLYKAHLTTGEVLFFLYASSERIWSDLFMWKQELQHWSQCPGLLQPSDHYLLKQCSPLEFLTHTGYTITKTIEKRFKVPREVQ